MSSLNILHCSESEKTEIFNRYGRTTVTIQQDIEDVKKWLKKQPHLPEIPADGLIERFLVITKFRFEKVKQTIDMYYTVRSLMPDFYCQDPNGDATRKFMQKLCYIPLPKLTEDFLRVIIVQVKFPEAELDAISFIAHAFNVADVRLREEHSFGEIHIYDLTNVKIHHLSKFTPTIVKKVRFLLERVYSNALKGIHYINPPAFAESFLKVIKSFFRPKLAQRIFIHKDMDSLYEFVPKYSLPQDYGGEEKSIEELEGAWKKKFLEYDLLFRNLRGLKVDEKLRPGEPLHNDLFGIDGNFRQLGLD